MLFGLSAMAILAIAATVAMAVVQIDKIIKVDREYTARQKAMEKERQKIAANK